MIFVRGPSQLPLIARGPGTGGCGWLPLITTAKPGGPVKRCYGTGSTGCLVSARDPSQLTLIARDPWKVNVTAPAEPWKR